jgi:opacity protein-like surface antigen
MKLASKFAALAFGLTAFSAVQAASLENLYGGVSYSITDIAGVSPNAIGVHVGAKLHPNLAAEARFGIGMGDDKGVEVDNYFSVLAKGILPIQDNLSVYGLVGFSRVAASFSYETVGDCSFDAMWNWVCTNVTESVSDSDSGLSLGAGAEFALTPKVSLSAEYLMMTGDVDVMSVAASYKF